MIICTTGRYKISKKQVIYIDLFIYVLLYYQTSSTDAVVTPTYDEIIVKPTTTSVPVPIYDTPMELQTNTPLSNKDIINVHNTCSYVAYRVSAHSNQN